MMKHNSHNPQRKRSGNNSQHSNDNINKKKVDLTKIVKTIINNTGKPHDLPKTI